MSWYQKACALKKDGNFQEAEAVLTKLIQQHEQQYGQDKDCLNYMDLRSECLVGIGKVTEAEQCFRSNLDRWNVLGGHLGKGKAARMRLEIGKCIRLQCEASKAVTEDSQMVITPSTKERYRECQKLFEEAIEEWKSLEPRQHKRIFQALINLSDTLDQLAEIAEENNAMEEALSLRVKAIKCDREALQYAKLKQTACTERTIAQCQWDLAQSLLKASERQEAKSVLVKLLAYMQEQRTTGKPLKDLDFNEKECQEWIKDCDAATETLRHVVEVWPRRFSVNHTRKRHHKRWMALIRTAIVNFWMNKLYFVIQQTVSDPDERADYLEAFKRRSFPRSPETLIRKEGFNRTRQPNLREQKASTNEGTQHDEFDEEHEQGALFNSGKVPNARLVEPHPFLEK
ncbi:hypothetical protein BU23DRAFT_302183 [Bimuria novae-zelandiae CBS 107.79]|uniref:TPR-like protein n=1 Tax=Bimuria novae-zelandiae CBS 107.79 TaxID=1447943 RepID=A0A6A5UR46_9PLEO|nr:hypothetical protein BU23DRAFT_302183 [Bimuria novae-zelandiae CBS 107.79]